MKKLTILLAMMLLFTVNVDAQRKRQHTKNKHHTTVSSQNEKDSQDLGRYKELYRKANNGDADSQYELAVHLLEKSGDVYYWAKKAADQNHPGGLFLLALCYSKGSGVDKDIEKYSLLCDIAYNQALDLSKKGDPIAEYLLGLFYETGTNNIPIDLEESTNWYRKSAEHGYYRGQYALGNNYSVGNGVFKDLEKAIYWYRKAAEQGFEAAQYELGIRYYDGKGVSKNDVKAVYWFRKAAEQGDSDSQYNLGMCYKEGNGVSKDYKQSFFWFKKAAEQGNTEAQLMLFSYYLDGKGVTKDFDEALNWLLKAAEGGNETAIKALREWEASLKSNN